MKQLGTVAFCLFFVSSIIAQKPQLKVQTGHSSFVSAMAFAPGGHNFITGGIDGQIKIWETASGREIRSISTKLPMYDMELNGDASIAVIVDFFANITFWDLNSGKQISTTTIKHVPTSLPQMGIATGLGVSSQVHRPISLKGNNLAVANEGDAMANILKLDKLIGGVSIFDMATGKKTVTFKPNKSAISAIAYATSDKLATADTDNYIKIWDANKGKEVSSFSSGQTKILSISANDNYVATGGASGSLKVWDLTSGKNIYNLIGHKGDLVDVSISSDGSMLVSTDKYSAKAWDLSTGLELFDNKVENTSGGYANICNISRFNADNSLMASSWFGTINLYETNSKSKLRTFEGSFGGVIDNIFMPGTNDPAMVIMTGDGVVSKRWRYPNNETKEIKVFVAGKFVKTHPNLESIIVFAPGTDVTIPVYNFEKGDVICVLKGHTAPVYSATYSPDGSLIVTGSKDNTVRIWDSKTGKELNQLSRRGFAATGFNAEVFISRDNKKILTRGILNTPTQVWSVENGRSTNLPNVNFVHIPKMSPDGAMIAGTGAVIAKKGVSLPQLMIFDASTGEKTGSFKGNPGSMHLSFSADSKSLALTVPDGVDVLDIASEELKYKLPHLDVNHFAFSDDNTRIMTSGSDGLTRLWDYETGEEIAAFVSFRANENTIVLPNRYYYSTKGAVKGIHYVMENKAIPFDQFDLQYNRPDLVFERLGVTKKRLLKSYNKAYKKRLEKNGFTEDMFSNEFHLPEVVLEKSSLPITTTNRKVKINFSASDSKYNLTKVVVSVNNIPIYGKEGLKVENSGKNISQEIEIELSNGRNKIGIMVVNEKGIKSIEQVVEIQLTASASKHDLYVVAIGVSEYQTAEMNLNYAAKDANDLTTALESRKEKYDNITVLKYLNKDATNDNILGAKKILKNSKVDDEVVIFVAGHGLLDKDLDYYLATYDVDFYHPSEKGLKYEDLEGLLDGIPARKKLMLLDACHSGEVDKDADELGSSGQIASTTSGSVKFRGFKPNGGSDNSIGLQNSFEMMQELFADLRRGTGAIVISAASGVELAAEDSEYDEHGLFTYVLLKALKSGKSDKDGDGQILVSELRDYVISEVVKLSDGKQHPTSRNENLEFDFKIW